MEESPSLEANMPSARQEIPRIYNSQQPVPILKQINPFSYSHPNFLSFISILPSQLSMGLPSGIFFSGIPTKILYASQLLHLPLILIY